MKLCKAEVKWLRRKLSRLSEELPGMKRHQIEARLKFIAKQANPKTKKLD